MAEHWALDWLDIQHRRRSERMSPEKSLRKSTGRIRGSAPGVAFGNTDLAIQWYWKAPVQQRDNEKGDGNA